jgi:ribosomal-protein-alanine N-acetyltransferase
MSGQTTSRGDQAAKAGDALIWSIGGLADSGGAALLAETAFDPHFREAWTESQIAGLLSTSSSWLELGHADETLVAFALSRQAFDEVELLLCAVRADCRRRGIGQRLIERVAHSARQRGARRLFLEVRCSNSPALALYKAFGFQTDGRRPGYYRTAGGESIDAITLGLAI